MFGSEYTDDMLARDNALAMEWGYPRTAAYDSWINYSRRRDDLSFLGEHAARSGTVALVLKDAAPRIGR